MAWLPVWWVAIVMAMAAWSVPASWRLTFEYDLPEIVTALAWWDIAAAALLIPGGLYLLGLAWRGSPRFAFWFTAWQALAILHRLGAQFVTLTDDVFVQTGEPWLYAAAEIGIGVWMIVLARRCWSGVAPAQEPRPAGALVYAINGLLGFGVGAAAGAAGGLVIGSLVVDALDVSCFEGGCGYAAVAIALLIAIVSAIAGMVFALVKTRGRAAA